MMRRVALVFALSLVPAAAMADSAMPQMDFQNPLTITQIYWMAVILVLLYFTLSRWGLPQIGKVLEAREAKITGDLEAARRAKTEADAAVLALQARMQQARAKAQADITKAQADAKAKAFAEAKALDTKLAAQLEYSERQIDEARIAALAAIKPVAIETATAILGRLTSKTPDTAVLAPEIDAALAGRKAA